MGRCACRFLLYAVPPEKSSDAERYEGAYTVIPDWTTQTLGTANRYLTDDVEVKPIPCESVSNLSGGRTVYIGGII